MFNGILRYIKLYETLVCAVILMLLLSGSCFCYAENLSTPDISTKNILFISSYSPSNSDVKDQIRGVESVLDKSINIEYEFLNSNLINYDRNSQQFLDTLQFHLNAAGSKFDLVIAGNNDALKFILENRFELFPNTPVVFLGVDNIELAQKASNEWNITGIAQKYDFEKNIKLAQSLFSKSNKIVAVIDDSLTGIGQNMQFSDAAKNHPDFEFIRINPSQLTESEIIDQISQLGSDSVLMHFSMTSDKNGKRFNEVETANIICGNSNIPVMRLIDTGIGDGYLGGCVISPYKQGISAAKIAENILNGERAENIPMSDTHETQYKFDYDIITKYKIDISAIPSRCVFENYRPSFREKYGKKLSLVSIAILLALVLLQLIIKWFESHIQNRRLAESSKNLSASLNLYKSIDAAKSEYINYAAHEIRKAAENSKDTEILKSINSFLDISAYDEDALKLKHETFNLSDILNTLTNLYSQVCSDKNIIFSEHRYEIEYNNLAGDPHKLTHVLSCILNNALNFTPNEKSVTLHTTQKRVEDGIAYIEFKIVDTGIGMSDEKVNSIFYSNTLSKPQCNQLSGSGIGLSIIRTYTKLMHGSLEAESHEGEGSIITVTFPFEIVHDKSDNEYENKPVEAFDFSGCTALIAEDNELNLAILSELLKEIGFNTINVKEGRQAVYAFNRALRDEINVILIDTDMPVMNGFEAANTIRKSKHANYETVPIIGMSPETSQYESDGKSLGGLTCCITKPINIDELYYTLNKYVLKQVK